jgi:Rieske Fe-S protein
MNDKCLDHSCPRRTIERRTLLKGGAAGTLLLALPLACDNKVSPPTVPVAAGNVSDLQLGTLRAVPNEALILGRDAGGVYAMSAACTHESCPVSVAGASHQLSCPCHGSLFDANGAVERGPAQASLPHYLVEIAADGSITVHGEQPVSADTRVQIA